MHCKGLTKENYSVKWMAGRGYGATKLALDHHLWIGYDSTMKRIDVVIPDEYVEQFHLMVDRVPPIAVVDALLWLGDLCKESDGTLPIPRYMTTKGEYLPDAYGFVYTTMTAIVGYKLAF